MDWIAGVEVGGVGAGRGSFPARSSRPGIRGSSTRGPRGDGTLRATGVWQARQGAALHATPARPGAAPFELGPIGGRDGGAAGRPSRSGSPASRRGGRLPGDGRTTPGAAAQGARALPGVRAAPAAQAGTLPVVRAAALSVPSGRRRVPPIPFLLRRPPASSPTPCRTDCACGSSPTGSCRSVSYYTFFRVGSRNERPGITGISHLFEHMMFNGSERFGPKEFDRVLEAHGGASNAYTSNDVTAYHDDFATDGAARGDRPGDRTGCARSASPRRGSTRSGRW